MNEATSRVFRGEAEAMEPEAHDWQWIGKWMSQRMFGITEARQMTATAKACLGCL